MKSLIKKSTTDFKLDSICVCFSLSSAEVDREFNPPPPTIEYLSTTKKDFSKGNCGFYWNLGVRGFVEDNCYSKQIHKGDAVRTASPL